MFYGSLLRQVCCMLHLGFAGQKNGNTNGKITWLQVFRECCEMFNDMQVSSTFYLQRTLLKLDVTFLYSSQLSYFLLFAENSFFQTPDRDKTIHWTPNFIN